MGMALKSHLTGTLNTRRMPHPSCTAATLIPSPVLAPSASPVAVWWLGALLLTGLWDLGGLDMGVMRLIGTPTGFALQHTWVLERVLHEGVRQAATGLFLLIAVWALWPARWNMDRLAALSLPRRERWTVLLLVTLSLIAVNLIKNASQTSCPWDLQAFGGPAVYVSHWTWGLADGGTGRCFPGGHASSAFAFLALSLPWLMPPAGVSRSQTAGLRWLLAVLFAGVVAGTVQTVRGAHYPSHTLWTLVICGGVSLAGWALFLAVKRSAAGQPQGGSAPPGGSDPRNGGAWG
jgi:membrane-associated PAP2 superfamily phosphatase